MKKYLKWYFKHLNWVFAIGIFIIMMVVDVIDTHHFNWILFGGLILFICVSPLYGIIQGKRVGEDKKMKKQKREEEIEKLVIEKLSQLENNELEDCPNGKKLAELMNENDNFRKKYEEHKNKNKN